MLSCVVARRSVLARAKAWCAENSFGRTAAAGPFEFKGSAGGKRFLRADTGGGKRGVQIGAQQGVFLGKAFPEKSREAADEGVAGTGGVCGRDLKRRNHFR